MGATLSITQMDKFEGKKYMSKKPLVKFPETKKRTPGQVSIIFKVLPNGVKVPAQEPDNLYWWPDVRFVPNADNKLLLSIGAFRRRPGRSPLTGYSNIHGLIYCLKINENSLNCHVYRGTRTSASPNLCAHPDGVDVSFVGCGAMHLMDLHTQELITRSKDVRNNNFRYTDCSPNGIYIATVAKCSRSIELHVMIIENYFFMKQDMVELHHICPGFNGLRNQADYFECRFSPDSSYIAVASSHGHLTVVTRRYIKEYCNIVPGIFDINDAKIANERSFDFDQRFKHAYLAFGSMNNEVFVCNIDEQTIVVQRKFEDLDGKIKSVKYGPRSRGLAIGTSTSVIYICDADTLDTLYELNSAQQGNAAMVATNGKFPGIVRMAFSTAGDNMAVTSTDGYCRIWQLEPNLNLQEICKLAIMQYCAAWNIPKLPLPPKLIISLLDWPV